MVISGLPRWVEYSLVLLAAWLVAGIIVAENVDQVSKRATVMLADETTAQFVVDEVLLKRVNLFGKAAAKESKLNKKPAVTTVSKLNVKLLGTVVAGNRSAAMVLMNKSKQQQLFFIGQTMQPQVVLLSVKAEEITVDNHGRSEVIRIEAGKKIHSKFPGRVKAAAPKVNKRNHIAHSIDRGHLQKQMRNFSTLLSQARVTPHFTGKEADGFTISEIVKGSLYEEVGLQNGDVIQKVNGESVTSAEQAMRMYQELQNATFIDVEINRGGTIQQVSYTVQ